MGKYRKESKHEFKEYIDKLSKEELKWIRQFYNEWYHDHASLVSKEKRIIQDDDMLKEARRNHNTLKRDIWEVSNKNENLYYLNDKDVEFMEDASDEWEWLDVYDRDGQKGASKYIKNLTIQRLEDETDWDTILTKYYVTMDRLRRHHNKELKIKREKNK